MASAAGAAEYVAPRNAVEQPGERLGELMNPIAQPATAAGVICAQPAYAVAGPAAISAKRAATTPGDAAIMPMSAMGAQLAHAISTVARGSQPPVRL